MQNEEKDIKNLSEKIEKLKLISGLQKIDKKSEDIKSNIAAEFLSISLVTGCAGYYLDKFFDSWPKIFIISCILGFITIFYNLYKKIK